MSSAESAGFVLLAGDPLVDSQFLRNSCSTSLACLPYLPVYNAHFFYDI